MPRQKTKEELLDRSLLGQSIEPLATKNGPFMFESHFATLEREEAFFFLNSVILGPALLTLPKLTSRLTSSY